VGKFVGYVRRRNMLTSVVKITFAIRNPGKAKALPPRYFALRKAGLL
jgi:hypothetical protein